MADARLKAVLSRLADLTSRTNYAVDKVRQLRQPLGRGDIVEVPSIGSLTVTADGNAGAAPQSITTSVLSCQANLHPAIFAALPEVDAYQLMDGNWASQVAEDAIVQLKNDMDEKFLRDYIALSLCYDTSATYHDNVAGDSLTDDDILNAKAALLANDGVRQENLALFVSSYGEGSIANISSFIPPAAMAISGEQKLNLGIPMVGSVSGVPVYSTNSVLRNRSVASTAWDITSNVLTVTVAAGHGFVPGMLCTFDTVTAGGDMSTPTAITSVTATTVVFAHTATDGSATEAGTLSSTTSYNVMLDRSQMFVAQQQFPKVRSVADYDSTDTALQVSAIWGRIGRAGRARVIHSPGSAI